LGDGKGSPPLSWAPARSQSARGLARSKTWRTFMAFWLLTFAVCLRALAESFSIDWFTIAAPSP
jgi:hypothetical protein